MQFILGAIVGAIAMALFAPQRGDVTREELRAATEDLRRRADDLSERARRASEEAQVRTQKLIEEARKQMQEIRPRDGGGGSATA
ncbi:MAG TPA: YtxH domain-containing protein [Candidatus Dormibacteraeota bacterium]|jgi:gas vesicle protein|nr:YtxH domain-containing protein [Candidatus Dormibacteraeota bacterium]